MLGLPRSSGGLFIAAYGIVRVYGTVPQPVVHVRQAISAARTIVAISMATGATCPAASLVAGVHVPLYPHVRPGVPRPLAPVITASAPFGVVRTTFPAPSPRVSTLPIIVAEKWNELSYTGGPTIWRPPEVRRPGVLSSPVVQDSQFVPVPLIRRIDFIYE